MARSARSNPFRDLFAHHGAADDARSFPDASVSILHALTRSRWPDPDRVNDGGAAEEREVVLRQSGVFYAVEMRARLSWLPSWPHVAGRRLEYRVFDSYREARDDFARALADPLSFGHAAAEMTASYRRPTAVADGSLAREVAAGRAVLPVGPAAGEVARQLWGRPEAPARAALLRFARDAPLTYACWSHWKWLYKRAETAPVADVELLTILIARLDRAPLQQSGPPAFSWLDLSPSPDTISYMKRRAHRFLRELEGNDSARHDLLLARIADYRAAQQRRDEQAHGLPTPASGGGAPRDGRQGAGGADSARPSLPLLPSTPAFAVSEPLHPSGAGDKAARERDGLMTVQEGKAARKRRHEYAVSPELLLRMYVDSRLPLATLEWVCRSLLAQGITPPTLSDADALRFLQARSRAPRLTRTARRQVMARIEDEPPDSSVSPDLAARALFLGGAADRARLSARLAALPERPAWDRALAEALCGLIGDDGAVIGSSWRRIDAAALLAGRYRYAAVTPVRALLAVVAPLFTTGRAEGETLVRTLAARLPAAAIGLLLAACEPLDAAQRRRLLDLLVPLLRERPWSCRAAASLAVAESPWVRRAGWRLIATSAALTREDVDAVWERALAPRTSDAALAGAIGLVDALDALRSLSQLRRLKERLQAQPALLDSTGPVAWALLLDRLLPGPGALLSLIGRMDERAWLRLRDTTLDTLREHGRLDPFWRALWARRFYPGSAADATLAARLLSDPTVAATFNEVADATYLDTTNSLLEPLLLRWVAAHPDQFERGSPALLAVATHPLTGVRGWGLRRTSEVSIDQVFALRLLASELPDAVAEGRAYVEAIPAGGAAELECAVALCQSPARSVQDDGRTFVAVRRATLPLAELARRLGASGSPAVRATMATALQEAGAATTAPAISAFDRRVLSEDRGSRAAKESVKRRLEHATIPEARPDRETLLLLARGGSSRDRDWALAQLARLTLTGEAIDGVTVEGTHGI